MTGRRSHSAAIEVVGLTKTYGSQGQGVTALQGLDMHVLPKEFVALVGPSGCGKSTLLYLVAGFEKPTTGTVLANGAPVRGPGPDRGIVFQELALFPWRTVIGNVAFGLEMQGVSKDQARETARRYVHLVGLEGFDDAYPFTLSGGMKQRVALARTLAYKPDVLLMDEPFGALDAQTRWLMQEELTRIWELQRTTVLFVTHSVTEAVYLADRVYVLTARPGRVKGEIDIPLARPRDTRDPGFGARTGEILALLEDEIRKANSEMTRPPGR